MAYSVEGTWKNFTFKIIEKEDMPLVHEHLQKYFLREEKTCELVGFSSEFAKDFEQIYDWSVALGDRLSFMAIDNSNGIIAGLRLTYLEKRNGGDFSHIQIQSNATKLVLEMFAILGKGINLFDHYGVDQMAFLLSVSVGTDYRNQGLATEMYKRSFALLRDRKITVARCIFSSPFSRKAADNFGFEELSRLYFKGLKNGEGNIMFPGAQEDDFSSLRCIRL